jgi:hypothetical protein
MTAAPVGPGGVKARLPLAAPIPWRGMPGLFEVPDEQLAAATFLSQ